MKPAAKYAFTSKEIALIRSLLLSWYDKNKRDLPWRRYADVPNITKQQHAYAVWVSEVMLQQTRVATVVDYYQRWMSKWPDLESLSQSTEEAVNQMWAGLGYYSRGRRLREGAIKIVEKLENKFPDNSVEMLKELPGVGRYTAAAISSIAFKEKVGVLDGNVTRVLCRLRRIGGSCTSKDVISHLWNLIDDLVDLERPGDFNQAIMELGATVCTPKSPNCSSCPLKTHCSAYLQVQEHSNNNNMFKNKENEIKVEKMEMNNLENQPIKVKSETRLKSKSSELKNEPNSVPIKTENQDQLDLNLNKVEQENEDINDIEDMFALSTPWDPVLGVTNYPFKPKKKPPRPEYTATCVLELKDHSHSRTRWLISKRPETGLLAGLWEFPNKIIPQIKNDAKVKKRRPSSEDDICPDSLNKQIKAELQSFSDATLEQFDKQSFKLINRSFKGQVVHIFSHITQTNYVEHIQLETKDDKLLNLDSDSNMKWVNSQELVESATSSAVLKIYKLCSNDHKTEKTYGRNKAKRIKTSQTNNLLSYFTKK